MNKITRRTIIAILLVIVVLAAGIYVVKENRQKIDNFTARVTWRRLCNKFRYDEDYKIKFTDTSQTRFEGKLQDYFDAGDFDYSYGDEAERPAPDWQITVKFSDSTSAVIGNLGGEAFEVTYQRYHFQVKDQGLFEQINAEVE